MTALNFCLLVGELGAPVFRENDTKTGTPNFPLAFKFLQAVISSLAASGERLIH